MLKCFGAALVKNTVNQEPLRYTNQASYKNLLYSFCLKTKKKRLGKSLGKINNTVLQMFIRRSSRAR